MSQEQLADAAGGATIPIDEAKAGMLRADALKRRSFPVSDFRQRDAYKIRGRRTAPEGKKNCLSEDQKWATGCILSDNGEPKMELPGKISFERSVVLTRGTELRAPVAEVTSQKLPDTSTHTLAEAGRAYIIATLRETNWVVGGRNGAAARLGLNRTTLIAKVRKLGILRETAEQSTGRSDTNAKAPVGRFSVPA